MIGHGFRRLSCLVPMVFALVAAACVPSLPGSGKPPTLYELTPKSTFPADLPDVDWQLVIEVPSAPASLESNRIMVRETETKISFIKDAAWADRAPNLIQTLLVESFENSDRIVAVGRESIGLRSDFVLKTDLREFQIEQYGQRQVRVRVNVKLVQMPKRLIVGSLNSDHVAPAGDTLESAVTAFDVALGKVLKDIVEWTLLTGAAQPG
jgi:cholesterol transport system auxiliary component